MFKDRFGELLQQRQITAYRVAKDISISQGQMNQYKNGNRTPPPENLAKIANYLGVSVDYLLGRTTDDHNIIGNANAVGAGLTDQHQALLELFDRLDVVRRAQLIAYAADLAKDVK